MLISQYYSYLPNSYYTALAVLYCGHGRISFQDSLSKVACNPLIVTLKFNYLYFNMLTYTATAV